MILEHGIAAHLDPVGVVHQPIEDAVGGSGIADLLVPAGHRKLGGENRGTDLIAILAASEAVVLPMRLRRWAARCGYALFSARVGKKKSSRFRRHFFATYLQKSRRPAF